MTIYEVLAIVAGLIVIAINSYQSHVENLALISTIEILSKNISKQDSAPYPQITYVKTSAAEDFTDTKKGAAVGIPVTGVPYDVNEDEELLRRAEAEIMGMRGDGA